MTRRERLFERAWEAHLEKNFELASERWRSFLSRYAEDAPARANYVVSLLAIEEPKEALRQAREGLRREPTFEGARTMFLNALEANGLEDEMELEALRQCRETPLQSSAWEARGRIALLWQDTVGAERHFREAVRLNPDSNFAWAHIAFFCLASVRFEEAVNAFGQMFATASDAPAPPEIVKHDALVNQAMCLLYLERPRAALVVAEQAEALNVNVGESRMVQARAKFSLGHSDAVTIAESAVRLGAKNGYLMMATANYYAESGDIERAKRILDSEAPSSDTYALNIRAAALAHVGRYKEAIQSLQDLKGSLPEFVRLNSLSAAHLIADNPQEALSSIREALKHKEDHIIHTNAGILCLQLGHRASSKEHRERLLATGEHHLKRALELEPDAPSAMYNLGLCYYLQDRNSIARSLLRKLAESTKFDGNLKAAARELLGRMEQGEEISDLMKSQDLSVIRRSEIEGSRQLLNHFRSRRFEDECSRWATLPKSPLSWANVELRKILKHDGRQKEIDVYSTSSSPFKEVVHLGECKLRIEKTDPVSEAELGELVSKMEFARESEAMSAYEVRGSFFSNADYSVEALEIAKQNGIRVYKARLKKNWRDSPDWRVTGIQNISLET